ncbi:MAG: hypothetical protein ABEJ85_04375 [Haloarculaceae archaeon]
MPSDSHTARLFDVLDEGWGLVIAVLVFVLLLAIVAGVGQVLAALWLLGSVAVTVLVVYLLYRLTVGVERIADAQEQLVAAEVHESAEIEVSPKREADADGRDGEGRTDGDGDEDDDGTESNR